MHKSSHNWLSAIINVQHFEDHTMHYNYMMYSATVLIYKKIQCAVSASQTLYPQNSFGSKNTVIIPNKI